MSMSSGSWSIPEVVQSFGHKGIDCISYVMAIARISVQLTAKDNGKPNGTSVVS